MSRKEPYNTDRARMLRRKQSPPEGVLWSRLRGKKLAGIKFRRQHPIGPFVVDFCCVEAMLVVELDSIYHTYQRDSDAARDAELRRRGYEVMRITAGDLATNKAGVLSTIQRIVEERMRELEEKEPG